MLKICFKNSSYWHGITVRNIDRDNLLYAKEVVQIVRPHNMQKNRMESFEVFVLQHFPSLLPSRRVENPTRYTSSFKSIWRSIKRDNDSLPCMTKGRSITFRSTPEIKLYGDIETALRKTFWQAGDFDFCLTAQSASLFPVSVECHLRLR